MRAAGVDGCRRGWVVATRTGTAVVDRLATVIDDRRFHAIGVDMPIGLPGQWGRACDAQARARIGPRRSSVFDTPPRALLGAPSFDAANTRSRELFGRGLSRQSFHLLPKIAEVDRIVGPEEEQRILEVHPETSFTLLAGEPLAPKRTAAGLARRRALLEPVFGPLPHHVPGASPDDVLDAYAVLWSVERYLVGEHVELGDGTRDERGILMRIVV